MECFSKLHLIGEVLSKYQTPRRREDELRKLSFVSPTLMKEISAMKISGTSNVSYKYMCEAIQAFLDGEIYGNFQEKMRKKESDYERHYKLSPKDIADEDIIDNPVVFRAINEVRKMVNAVIDAYGSPEYINVEVASDLSRAYEERMAILKSQRENEKENDVIREKIAKIIGAKDSKEVKVHMIERYRLYELQDGKCMYSGRPLCESGDLREILEDKVHMYEVDHIVPYSLILDNTLNNKALVFTTENQVKGQGTPLMYLSGTKREGYLNRVKHLYTSKDKRKSIGTKKYEYLMLENLSDESLLNNWKSRNINDTRYITKYIVNLLEKKLIFDGEKAARHVFGVRGVHTSKFRRIWLEKTEWGGNEKKRDSYFNHAVDAVVIANLTPAYLEIASDSMKLLSIYKRYHKVVSGEYEEYLTSCIKKMKKHYGFSEDYTRNVLSNLRKVPSYLPDIAAEVAIRFDISHPEEFQENIQRYYGKKTEFIMPPTLPVVSIKQEQRFRGQIADSQFIKVIEENGLFYKVSRKRITDITKKDLNNIRTDDVNLVRILHDILDTRDDKYSIKTYMEEQGLTTFVAPNGQRIYKISVQTPQTNFYKLKNGSSNTLSMLKYYCVEIYEDKIGKTRVRGIRYVDVVKKDKKLFIKETSMPEDYGKHIMYLHANDYLCVYNKKGELKIEGYYQSVKSISSSRLYFKVADNPEAIEKVIGKDDTVVKMHISLLGKKEGVIKCSEPLSLIRVNL